MGKPKVSIVVPIYNDEEYLSRALDSLVNQTEKNIEIVCVDDCSTDGSYQIAKQYAVNDSRIKLIRQSKNASAFQARKVGIEKASADYIMFLDGDDEYVHNAVKTAYSKMQKTGADVVHFGANIIRPDGTHAKKYERSIQPKIDEAFGLDILRNIMGSYSDVAQGTIWKYLWRKELLLKAYAGIADERFYRANDTPIAFVALSQAHHYVALPAKLYNYYYVIGSSGHSDIDIDEIKFYASSIDSVGNIPSVLGRLNLSQEAYDEIYRCYELMRLSIISVAIQYVQDKAKLEAKRQGVEYLLGKITPQEAIRAICMYKRNLLPFISENADLLIGGHNDCNCKNIVIHTNNLRNGGLQNMVLNQAKIVRELGYNVTIILDDDSDDAVRSELGCGDINVVQLEGEGFSEKFYHYCELVDELCPMRLIDHNILYNRIWPFVVAYARSRGAKATGWLHNFALRPVLEGNDNVSFILRNVSFLDNLIVLSRTDVVYWRQLGIKNVYYIQNTIDDEMLASKKRLKAKKIKSGQGIKLLWVGRLQEKTKRVLQLPRVAEELLKLTSNFVLDIVGPESPDLTFERLQKEIDKRGVTDYVNIVGEKSQTELPSIYAKHDLFVNTSLIEGFPLVISEAQRFGLPVIMYELPWLETVSDGVVSVEQSDARGLANAIYAIMQEPKKYVEISSAATKNYKRLAAYDVHSRYQELLDGALVGDELDEELFVRSNRILAKFNELYCRDAIARSSRHAAKVAQRRIKRTETYKVARVITMPLRGAKWIIGRTRLGGSR